MTPFFFPRADSPRRDPRAGYALLAVLWICLGVAALGLVIAARAREAVARSRNRASLSRAEWLARGCLAEAQARAAALVARPHSALLQDDAEPWGVLDSALAVRAPTDGCVMSVRAPAAELDVNAAPDSLVATVLRNAGAAPAAADSFVAALADWKDEDDDARPEGAERDWYLAHDRVPPSNRPFTDAREIGLVRGAEAVRWRGLLGVDGGGAISLREAPPAVLAALPGFGPAAVERTLALRGRGQPLQFRSIADGLPDSASTALMDALPRLAALATLEPPTWIVRAEAADGTPPVTVAAEMRLARTGMTVTAVDRRVEYP